MPRQFNRVRAASALVEAVLKTDRQVAIEFGVSVRAIEYWRSRLKVDEELQGEFRKMANDKLSQWVGEIPDSLAMAIGFIASAARSGDVTSPEMVNAMTRAIATLNEVMMVQEAMSLRKAAMEA